MKHTNKKTLLTGIKFMAVTLPLMFAGPYFITLGFLNKTNSMFYVFFSIGLILSFFAVFFAFRGIKFIIKSVFD